MPKKPTKSKLHIHQPEPAQIKAVERLIADQEHAKAVQRLRGLIQRFPDHGGLRRLLVETLGQGESTRAAGLAAFEWAEHRPNSVPAQETLLTFALRLGHILLADRTARRLRELGMETPGFPVNPAELLRILELPDGTRANVEEVEQFDIGKLYLDAQDFAGALRRLEGLDIVSARNNRAMALFHLGRIDESLTAFMAAWDADAANLFALGWAVRLRLYRGDETGAYGLTTPLAAATARRLDDALIQLDALLLLQKNAAAWDAFERFEQCAWSELGDAYSRALLLHFAACAASRLGKTADARRRWREAVKLAPDFQPARHNLERIQRDDKAADYPRVFDLTRGLPLAWINELRTRGKQAANLVDTLTASNLFLEAIYLGGDESLNRLAGLILRHRAERADLDAARALQDFARLPIGTNEERYGFLRLLQEQKLIGLAEPVEIWDGEQLRQIKMISTEIYREAQKLDLPKDLEHTLGEFMSLFKAKDYAGAEDRLNRILERVPNHSVAMGNLAGVRSMQGRHEEAHELLRQVVARHPDYLIARCNLARILIQDGNLDEANDLLKGLAERERLHIQEVFSLYGTLAMLNRARGENDLAAGLIANLETLVEDEDDARRLEFVKRLQTTVKPPRQ